MFQFGNLYHVNVRLTDLNIIDEKEPLQESDFKDISSESSKLKPIICDLMKNICVLERTLNSPIQSTREDPTIEDIKLFLVEHDYYGDIDNLQAVDVLDFLSSELQTLRVLKHTTSKYSKPKYSYDECIKPVCKTIGINTNQTTSKQIEDIINYLNQSVEQGPPILNENEYSEEEKAFISNLDKCYFEDFNIRKKMLLQRLDVTIQSMLWSNKAKGIETDIISSIEPFRIKINKLYNDIIPIESLFKCSANIIKELSQKVTSKHIDSIAKHYVIDNVPDRGGRTITSESYKPPSKTREIVENNIPKLPAIDNNVELPSGSSSSHIKPECPRDYCKMYFDKRSCSYGDRCKFYHEPPEWLCMDYFFTGDCNNANCMMMHKIPDDACYDYLVYEECSKRRCRFKHPKYNQCPQYFYEHKCQYGDKCKYRH